MITARCTEKLRDNSGKIHSYVLEDSEGKIAQLTSYELKNAITNGEIVVTNLQIDKVGRLVDKSETTNNQAISMMENQIQSLIIDKIIYIGFPFESNYQSTSEDLREQRTNVVRKILYCSEPGVKFIITKKNLDKKLFSQCKRNIWVTKGYKMWEGERFYSYLEFHEDNNLQILGEHNDIINYFVELIEKNEELLEGYKAIKSMQELKNSIHKFVEYMYHQKSYRESDIKLNFIPKNFKKVEKVLIACGAVIKSNGYKRSDIINGTEEGSKNKSALIKEINSITKFNEDYIGEVIKYLSSFGSFYIKEESCDGFRYTEYLYDVYPVINKVLKKHNSSVELIFNEHDNGYSTDWEIKGCGRNK